MNIFLVIHELINQADQVNVTLTNHVGAYIGAGMAMTAAAGVGVGQGFASGLCATALARNPELLPKFSYSGSLVQQLQNQVRSMD